jgi:hypothetical protein
LQSKASLTAPFHHRWYGAEATAERAGADRGARVDLDEFMQKKMGANFDQ